MRKLLTTVTGVMLIAAAAPVAHADLIIDFSQQLGNNPIIITANVPTDTSTNIAGTDIPVTISDFNGVATAINAFFTLNANSVGPATTVPGGQVDQAFTGTFSFTSGTGGSGIDYLSGSFLDAVFGAGTSLSLMASNAAPGETVSLASSVIPIANLQAPEAITLSFANVLPPVGQLGNTLGSQFGNPVTASVSGDSSATHAVPEPSSMALLGTGLLGLGLVARRRRRRA